MTLCTEKTYVNKRWRFGGTVDWIGQLTPKDPQSVIDYKTGSEYPEAALQTAGYAILAKNDAKPLKRYALYLLYTGKYKLVPFEETTDEHDFLGCLATARWKLRHGWEIEK
jgi:hypothetical protein